MREVLDHRDLLLRDTHATLGETLDVLQAREIAKRRRFLGLLGSAAALSVIPGRGLGCTLIPSETGGPYPGDGTNGPNVLTQVGILRSDIRASFGAAGTTQANGTVLTVTLRLVSSTSACAPLEGLAVYLWHCDAAGGYSMYSAGITQQNFLRGVQISDANGELTFTTIFPGCYPGRWPHMHFEIYGSAAQATSGTNALRTSQLALPEAACRAVYQQSAVYPQATGNLNGISLATDNVFSNDLAVNQLATTTGDNASGYACTLEVGVAVTPSGEPNAVFANGYEDPVA